MDFMKKYKVEIGIFAIAIFLVCLYANGGNIPNTVHGEDGYFEISRNLLLGNGFSINSEPPFYPYSYGVPGYPYFLFLLLSLTNSYLAVGMFQLILGALIPIMGMYIARLLVPGYKRIAIAVGLLLALSPYQVLFSFIFYTETFFIVVFGLSFIYFLKFMKTPTMSNAVLSGALLGLATLTKATVQYVFVVAIAFALWHFRKEITKRMCLQLAAFFLVFLAVLAPWFYRNYITFHIVSLNTQMSFYLYGGLLPSVLAIENGTSFAEEQKTILKANPLPLGGADSSELSKTLGDKAALEIVKHPVALVQLGMVSAVTFFTHDGMLTFLQAAGIKPDIYLAKPALVLLFDSPVTFMKTMLPYLETSMVFVLIARLVWIALTLCFFFGLYRLFRARLVSSELLFSVIIVLYFMLTTMVNGLSVNARFRMPVEPIIFTIAFAGLMLPFRKQVPSEHA